MKPMKIKKSTLIATWDRDQQIELSPRFVAALEELGRAEIEMMSECHGPECWSHPGNVCTIVVGDLARRDYLSIQFDERGKGDKRPQVNVIVAEKGEQ